MISPRNLPKGAIELLFLQDYQIIQPERSRGSINFFVADGKLLMALTLFGFRLLLDAPVSYLEPSII